MITSRGFKKLTKLLLLVITIIATIIFIFPQNALSLSYEQVSKLAETFTIVIDGCSSGSGVIVNRNGDTYYALTSKHVFKSGQSGCIAIAPSGDRYPINSVVLSKSKDIDLALIIFKSPGNYSLAELGNSNKVKIGSPIYVAGFPAPDAKIPARTLQVTQGNITSRIDKTNEGYDLVYSNRTIGGMSGGAVLNEKGELIGIHGQSTENKLDANLGISVRAFSSSDLINLIQDDKINLDDTEGFNWHDSLSIITMLIIPFILSILLALPALFIYFRWGIKSVKSGIRVSIELLGVLVAIIWLFIIIMMIANNNITIAGFIIAFFAFIYICLRKYMAVNVMIGCLGLITIHWIILRIYVYEPGYVFHNSMAPIIRKNDRFVVDKISKLGSSGFEGISRTNGNRKPVWAMITA